MNESINELIHYGGVYKTALATPGLLIIFFWNNPNLKCFYLVIQGGSTDMNEMLWTAGTFVTWDSKPTYTQKNCSGYKEVLNIMKL